MRRVLVGKVQPTWPTAEAILHALCHLAGRNVAERRWPDEGYDNDDPARLDDHLQALWNAMIDEEPRTEPPRTGPLIDPWATVPGSTEEPPF